MDVYVIVGLLRDSRLEYTAITKSKFSKNLKTPLFLSQGNTFS